MATSYVVRQLGCLAAVALDRDEKRQSGSKKQASGLSIAVLLYLVCLAGCLDAAAVARLAGGWIVFFWIRSRIMQ